MTEISFLNSFSSKLDFFGFGNSLKFSRLE